MTTKGKRNKNAKYHRIIKKADDLRDVDIGKMSLVKLDLSNNPEIRGSKLSSFVSNLCELSGVTSLNLSRCELFGFTTPEDMLKAMKTKFEHFDNRPEVLEDAIKIRDGDHKLEPGKLAKMNELLKVPICNARDFFISMGDND